MKGPCMPPVHAWQLLAKTFQLTEVLVLRDRLPEDFKPEHAVELYKEPISTHERSQGRRPLRGLPSHLSFLLHVWNRYDYSFDLSEVAMWNPEHQRAFCDWASGKTLGKRCRYF